MNHIALNTKIKARKNIRPVDIYEETKTLSSYVFSKPARDFVKLFTNALAGTFPAETKIRHWSFFMWQKLYLVDKSSQKTLKKIFAFEMDMRNILWIYRLKKYRNITGDAVYGYLLPVSIKLNKETLQKLVAAKDEKNMIDVLKESSFKNIFSSISDFKNGEIILLKEVERQFRLKSYETNLTSFCGYIYKRFTEGKYG